MKLYRDSEVRPDKSGLLCRQSRLAGILGTMLICGLFTGIPIVWWKLGAPPIIWGGCALLALIIVPLLLRDLPLRLRSSSWVLWIRPDGLWIRFRSYQERHAPQDDPAVAHVELTEVSEVRPIVENYTTPGGHGHTSVRHREQALLIRLNGPQGEVLQQALAAERSRMPPKTAGPGFQVAGRASHFAVTMPSPTVIRIAWRGRHSNYVTPPLERALDHLQRVEGIQFPIETDPLRLERPEWHLMDDAQLDALVRHLAESGARIEADRLLVRRKGCSTTDAHRHIEEVMREPMSSPPEIANK